MSTLHEITSEADFTTQLSSLPATALAVLSFHTPWAAPCTQMRTVLSTLASTYPATTPPSIVFLSINAEDLPDISERYDVSAVPFLVLLRNNESVATVSGSDPIKVREAIEKHVGLQASDTDRPSIPPLLTAVPRAQGSEGATSQQHQQQEEDAANGQTEEPPAPTKEELFARLSELVKAAPVMLFMKGTPSVPQCGFSRQIVGILREKGVKYGFFNILADEDVRQGLKEFADWPTFPQLWVKGELVGGLDIVKEEVAANPDFFRDYSVSKAPNVPAT
ncbi:glutaredoxin [Emydomyces testavorans]|uniref:Glutaredoxin n=1 Tax=Emydomyces testavorans TaxID=2070801 RepID=A0AAF0IIZ4_9EURO|nr:glutaredoxin [Emydomyces testavorans]